jgi:hypothetical protein
MARFRVPYTSHDFTSSEDIRILQMEGKLGIISYAIYWKLIEKLGLANNYELIYDIDTIAYMIRCKSKKKLVKAIIEDFDLFTIKDGKFYSKSLTKRMLDAELTSEQRAKKDDGKDQRIADIKTRLKQLEALGSEIIVSKYDNIKEQDVIENKNEERSSEFIKENPYFFASGEDKEKFDVFYDAKSKDNANANYKNNKILCYNEWCLLNEDEKELAFNNRTDEQHKQNKYNPINYLQQKRFLKKTHNDNVSPLKTFKEIDSNNFFNEAYGDSEKPNLKKDNTYRNKGTTMDASKFELIEIKD